MIERRSVLPDSKEVTIFAIGWCIMSFVIKAQNDWSQVGRPSSCNASQSPSQEQKSVVDFLLVFIELFSLGVMSETLRANIGSKSAISLERGPVDTKFQIEEVAPTNHSFSQKTRLNNLSYGIKYGQNFLPFCHNARV